MTKLKARRYIRLKEWEPSLNTALRPHPDYLAATDGSLKDQEFRLRTDANGFILPPPPDSLSVDETFLFFGDSFVESAYVSEPGRFVAGVQTRLREAGMHVRCLNAGYSGATTLHMLMALLGKVGRSPATRIVLVVPSNDVLALIKKGGYWCMNDRRYAPIIPVPEGGETGTQKLDLDDIRAVLNLFVDACRRMKLPLVLATFPHRTSDFASDPWLPKRFKNAGNCNLMRRWCESVNGVVRSIAARLDLPFVDLDAQISAQSELFYDYLHMNEKGSSRVAEIFSEFFLAQRNHVVGGALLSPKGPTDMKDSAAISEASAARAIQNSRKEYGSVGKAKEVEGIRREEQHVIEAPSQFSRSEEHDAKKYWSTIDVSKHDTYLKQQPWSIELAELFSAHAPKSILEFGCNAGKNLISIRERLPDAFLAGIDINPKAIEIAQSLGLHTFVGDQDILKTYSDRNFDICFTVSVLDHLPDPAPVIRELARITSKALYFLEPWLGSEGRVVRNYNHRLNQEIETTPYSYSWDLSAMVNAELSGWHLSTRPMPLPTNLGPHYVLFKIIPPSENAIDPAGAQ